MEKVQNKIINLNKSESLEEYQKELYNQIFNSKYYPLLVKQGWTNEEIFENVTKFSDYIEDLEISSKIKTYEDCLKYNKFQRVVLVLRNDVIDMEYVPLKPCIERAQYLTHFIRKDFSEELNNAKWDKLKSGVKKAIISLLKEGKWIYLTGAMRSGRTYSATALINAKYVKQDGKIAFANTPKLISEINNEYFKDRASYNEDIEIYSNVPVLVLDDFGSEYKNEIVRDMILFPILKERAAKNLLTIFTSDYSINEVASLYSFSNASNIISKQLKEMLSAKCGKAIVVNEISVY